MTELKTGKEHDVLDELEHMEPSVETYAAIMARDKPDPKGPGYIKLYLLSCMIFFCSTMNGKPCTAVLACFLDDFLTCQFSPRI